MKQATFASAAWEKKGKVTRREPVRVKVLVARFMRRSASYEDSRPRP